MTFYDWWYGLFGLSLPLALCYFLLTTHITFIAITLYLHRHSAHRSLDLHPALCHFFRFVLWCTTGMVTQEWTAVHRKHHASTEVEGDPHSPVVFGLWNIIRKGSEYYRDGITEETLRIYGKGTPDDWLERNVYGCMRWQGVGLLLVVDLVLFGVIGVIVWALQMIWTPFWGAGIINGVGHAIGYRNYESQDASKNIVPIGILVCGEELHNNHHTYPNSARFSIKRWEFDLGWQYIRLLTFLKLAKPLHTGPVVKRDVSKTHVDMDTIWALVNDRFRVMAIYAEKVVKPVVQSERNKADNAMRKLLRRSRKVLCSHQMVLGAKDISRIREITDRVPLLKSVYELRLELNSIWARRGGAGEELLQAFKNWCTRAEATGIDVLDSFVAHLKTYTVPQKSSATA